MKPLQTLPLKSIASNVTTKSIPIDCRQLFNFSLQAQAAAGSCDGTFQIQVCNTPCLGAFNLYNPPDVQWTNLGSSLTFSQASTASTQLAPKTDIAHVALRVVFTDSSTGTNTALITAALFALGV